jgi:hypothetical protein
MAAGGAAPMQSPLLGGVGGAMPGGAPAMPQASPMMATTGKPMGV